MQPGRYDSFLSDRQIISPINDVEKEEDGREKDARNFVAATRPRRRVRRTRTVVGTRRILNLFVIKWWGGGRTMDTRFTYGLRIRAGPSLSHVIWPILKFTQERNFQELTQVGKEVRVASWRFRTWIFFPPTKHEAAKKTRGTINLQLTSFSSYIIFH